MKIVKIVMVLNLVFAIIFVTAVISLASGRDSGARQMARHILNPKFESDGFYKIMGEECGSNKGWMKKNGCIVVYKDGITFSGAVPIDEYIE